VLDAINRGGSYSMRIRQLGPFTKARRCVPSFPCGLCRGQVSVPRPWSRSV